MTREEWLKELEDSLRQQLQELIDRLLRYRVQDGLRLRDALPVMRQIEYRVISRLVDPGLFKPETQSALALDRMKKQKGKEATKDFLAALIGRGFSLPAGELAKVGPARKKGRLNGREACCLWLGLFREQTSGLSGLWQMYLDIRMYLDVNEQNLLPHLIQEVFHPEGIDGENQEYISGKLNEANKALKEANGANEAREGGFQLADKDTSKILAWTVETEPLIGPRRRRKPLSLADRVQALKQSKSKLVAAVDEDLLRGGNTLRDAFVRRVFGAIDNTIRTSRNEA